MRETIINTTENVQKHECAIASIWLGSDGIVHMIAKHGPRTKASYDELINATREITNGKQACIIGDMTRSFPPDRETRRYAATELAKVCKAYAAISHSALGRMLANIYLYLKPSALPMRIFADEGQARNWLKQYCEGI